MFYRIQDGNQTDLTTPVFHQFTLDCGVDDQDTFENFIWIKPMGAIQFQSTSSNCSRQDVIVEDKCLKLMFRIYSRYEKSQIAENGSLTINDFGWSDRGIIYDFFPIFFFLIFFFSFSFIIGKYECLAYDNLGRFQSVFTNVLLEPQYRTNLYYLSLVWGFATAGGFLLLTLFFKLIHFLLHK